MQTDQFPDSYIYIALILAGIAAFASTPRLLRPSENMTSASAAVPADSALVTYSPLNVFGEAIPWEPAADQPDLTASP